MMEYQDVPVTICFNKKDLLEEQAIEEFAGVYKKCGYSVLYTSAEKKRESANCMSCWMAGQLRSQDLPVLGNHPL